MVFNILLSSSDVANSNNTLYEKQFCGGSLTLPEGSEICISQIVIPYSWFNITSGYNNNSLSYFWNGYYPSVIWNGSMVGTLFTGTADTGSSGSLVTGQMVIGTNLPSNTVVSSLGTGTVTLSNTFTSTSPTIITGIPTFTGYITSTTTNGVTTSILTLSTTVTGTFALNTVLYSSNTGLASNVYIVSLISGTLGANNSTYLLANQSVSVGSSGSKITFGFIGTYNTITFPDGFYETTDINNYIQSYMISKNHYLYNSTLLQNQYFSYFYANNTYYANQFVLSPIPSSFTAYTTVNSSSAYTLTTGFPFSAIGNIPQMVVYNGMVNYLGITAGIYPSTPVITSSSIISNITPIASTVNSIMVRCNLVINGATMPSDIIDTFYPNTTFGYNISYEPPYQKWVSVVGGIYDKISINFQDQNQGQIYARDNNILISLLIRFGDFQNTQTIVQQTIIQEPPKVRSVDTLNFKE